MKTVRWIPVLCFLAACSSPTETLDDSVGKTSPHSECQFPSVSNSRPLEIAQAFHVWRSKCDPSELDFQNALKQFDFSDQ